MSKKAHERRLADNEAQAVANRLSVKYTGADFPWRSPNTVAFLIEAGPAHHVKLPFEHS